MCNRRTSEPAFKRKTMLYTSMLCVCVRLCVCEGMCVCFYCSCIITGIVIFVSPEDPRCIHDFFFRMAYKRL